MQLTVECHMKRMSATCKDIEMVIGLTCSGEHQEKKIGYICRGQAYYWTGPKKGEQSLMLELTTRYWERFIRKRCMTQTME